jgi:hypothetical protein
MEVDPTTLSGWEGGRKEPWGKFEDRVKGFLGLKAPAREERGAA